MNRIFRMGILLSLAFISLASVSFSATCASAAYGASCLKCPFDQGGKMDQQCYESEQNKGIACLFSAYPAESIAYKMGGCPAIDVCTERLQTCKAIYSSGNDAADCYDGSIDKCFRTADTCVQYAVKNCSGTPPGELENVAPDPALCDSFYFMILLPFVGAMYCSKRN